MLDKNITQRSLVGDLGVALGLTNLLIRRLVGEGYVKIAGMGTRHIRYLTTAAGWDPLPHATRQLLEKTVHRCALTRARIPPSLLAISERCDTDAAGQKRILSYGAGDVVEIAYVSLQRTDLTLVGVADDQRAIDSSK
jgi:hypothetical protein